MMRTYDLYKDSGIEWIGEIPRHWEVSRFKYKTETPIQYGLNTSSDNYTENGIRFVRITDINDDSLLIDDNGKYLDEKDVPTEYLLNKYDVLFCRSGHTVGKSYLHLLDGKYTSGGYLVRLNFGNYIESKFVIYISKTQLYWDWIRLNTVVSTIENVNGEKYNNFIFPLPPLSEQEHIVSYLDEKTSLIDEMVEKKKRKIELLKEYRTSLINTVVTKGLNPDVPMKDSGIEWIGKIPSHWVTSKVRYELSFFNNIRIPLSSEERDNRKGEYRYYGSTGIIDFIDDFLFDGEFILIGEDGSNLVLRNYPLSNVVTGKFWVNNHSHILKSQFGVNKYFSHLLEMTDYTIFITGSTQPKLTMDNLKEVSLVVPPISEQEQIVSYLDEKTSEIDKTIELENKKIELLKEYRQSLISNVVTGKIKVTIQ